MALYGAVLGVSSTTAQAVQLKECTEHYFNSQHTTLELYLARLPALDLALFNCMRGEGRGEEECVAAIEMEHAKKPITGRRFGSLEDAEAAQELLEGAIADYTGPHEDIIKQRVTWLLVKTGPMEWVVLLQWGMGPKGGAKPHQGPKAHLNALLREQDSDLGGVAIRGSITDEAKEAVVKAKHAMDVLALLVRPKGRGARALAWDAAKDKLDKALAVKLEALAAEQAGRTHVAKAAVEVAAEVAQEVAGGAEQPSLAKIKAREKARVEKMSKAVSFEGKAAVEVAAEVAQEVAGGAEQPSLAEIKAREKARVEKMSKAQSTAREFLLYRVSFGAIIILPFRPPPLHLHTHTLTFTHTTFSPQYFCTRDGEWTASSWSHPPLLQWAARVFLWWWAKWEGHGP